MYILLDTACSTNVVSGACLINHIKKTYIHTHIHTYIHTYIHKHTNIYGFIQTHIRYSGFHPNYGHRHESMIYIHTHSLVSHGNYIRSRRALTPQYCIHAYVHTFRGFKLPTGKNTKVHTLSSRLPSNHVNELARVAKFQRKLRKWLCLACHGHSKYELVACLPLWISRFPWKICKCGPTLSGS